MLCYKSHMSLITNVQFNKLNLCLTMWGEEPGETDQTSWFDCTERARGAQTKQSGEDFDHRFASKQSGENFESLEFF